MKYVPILCTFSRLAVLYWQVAPALGETLRGRRSLRLKVWPLYPPKRSVKLLHCARFVLITSLRHGRR